MSRSKAQSVSISPFNRNDLVYIVFSAPNLSITIEEAVKLLSIKINTVAVEVKGELVFFNERSSVHSIARPNAFSAYKNNQLTSTSPVRTKIARKYEEIVAAAQTTKLSVNERPQIDALGFRAFADMAEPLSLRISEILGLPELFYPMIAEGVAEYDGFRTLYRVYMPVAINKIDSNETIEAKPVNVKSLEDARRIWLTSDDRLSSKQLLEDELNAKWPNYTYEDRRISDYYDSVQAVARDRGIEQYWSIPLHYNVRDDTIFSGLDSRNRNIEGMRDDIDEYNKTDDVMTLFS